MDNTGYENSQATTILVLGILSIVVCGLLGPVAWVMGKNELEAIDAGRRAPEGRQNANIGKILGMIASALMVIGIIAVIVVLGFGVASSA